jgi:hypothetical protein
MKTLIKPAATSRLGLKAKDVLHPFDLKDVNKISHNIVDTVCEIPDFAGTGMKAEILACKEVLPHTDDNWSDCVFACLALQACHDYMECVSKSQHSRTFIHEGSVWLIDPRNLHWVESGRPDRKVAIIASISVPRRNKKKLKEVLEKLIG